MGGRLVSLTIGVLWATAAVAFQQNVHSGAGDRCISPGGLRDLAPLCGIWIGPAVAYGPLVTEPIYGEVLAREFNLFTPENEMKWAPIHPQRSQYSFARADALVDFAAANGIALHGHTLVWHQQVPDWLSSGSFTRDEMVDILRDHIYTVAGRYSGYAVAWDVVNEAFNDDGTLRHTLWLDRIGPDYIDLAFQFASDADPYSQLIYNDYGNEGINAKSTAIYNMVSGMLDRGVPIHGVGFQLHITLSGIDLARFSQNMQRFADLGLVAYISELDVRIELPVTDDKLATQADVYQGILNACLNQPACQALQMWGFTDAHSWVPGFYRGFGAALIFDESYQPKPAYDALFARLNQCSQADQ